MDNNIILTDISGKSYKAKLLFTHFDYFFGKNYIVYLLDDDLLAASYETNGDKYIINCDLSSKEYDMIDETIARKLGETYAC